MSAEDSILRTESSVGSSPQPVVLDASVWVSRIIVTDSNHTAAKLWTAQYLRAHGIFVIPTLFEVEVAAAVARVTKDAGLARRQVAQVRRMNSRGVMRVVPLEPRLVRRAIDLAVTFGLRSADAIYTALAQQLGLTLVTFDGELLNLPAPAVTTIHP